MTAQSNQGSDTPTPACYATFRDGKMDYSEFCVSENLGDFDVSELDADVDIVPLYSEETVSELLAALTAERARSVKLREEVLEEAAKVADNHSGGPAGKYDFSYTDEHAAADRRADEIAVAIRAMKEKK